MAIYESAAETAKKIRKELKRVFPDLPARHFSVKSSNYAGGSSVSVRWTDFPLDTDVNDVVKKFSSSSFDGMVDLKTHTGYEYEGKMYSGADYILPSRDVSPERRELAERIAAHVMGDWDGLNHAQQSNIVREIDANLDRDMNYTGDYDITGLPEVVSAKDTVYGQIEDRIDEVAFTIRQGLDESTKDWHSTRKSELSALLPSKVNIVTVEDHYNQNKGTKTIDSLVNDLKGGIESGLRDKYQKVAEYLLEVNKDLTSTVVSFGGLDHLEDEVINDYVRDRFYIQEAREALYQEMLNVELRDESRWLKAEAAKVNTELATKYPKGEGQVVRDMVSEEQGTEEQARKEFIQGEIDAYVKKLTTYGVKGTEKWHDSRLNRVAEQMKTEDAFEEIELAYEKRGETVVDAVATEGGILIEQEESQALRLFHDNIDTMVTDRITLLGDVPEDVQEYSKNYLERELFNPETQAENDKRLMSVVYGGERDWFIGVISDCVQKMIKEQNMEAALRAKGTTGAAKPAGLTQEEKKAANVIVDGVYRWLKDNGYKIDKKKAKVGITESQLVEIKEQVAGKSMEEQTSAYEEYVFGVCAECIIGVKLTKEDQAKVTGIFKKQVGLLANEGKVVNLVDVKAEFGVDMELIAGMKKVKWQAGSFEDEVTVYMKALCEKHIETPVAVAAPIDPSAVVVNGVDIKAVIEALQGGLVTLTFEKADQTLRTMIGTRSANFTSELGTINDESEVNKQIGKGLIPVWDMQKNEMRAFNMGRLITYTVNGETIVVGEEQNATVDPNIHFNPASLTTDQMMNVLNKSVVRVVFEKKDLTVRVMWGTRNPAIIEMYQPAGNPMLKDKREDIADYETEQKREAQISGDYIKVFDVTVNEFRTFKPSTVLRMDEAQNVASWIEFKPAQDGWYNCIYAGTTINKYYEAGKRKAIDSPERDNLERISKERDMQRLHDEVAYTREGIMRQREQALEQDTGHQERVTDRNARWAESNAKVRAALATVGEYTEQDDVAFEKMVQAVDKMQTKFINLQREGKGRGEITEVKALNPNRIIMFKYDEDKYILHPRFMVNGISHRVFADRTGEVSYENNARRSEGDTELIKELESLAVLVTGRRVRNALDVTLVEEDIRRLRRAVVLAGNQDESLRTEKIRIGLEGAGNGVQPHLKVIVDGKRFVISPGILYNVDMKTVVFKRERHTATLAEFRDTITSHNQLGIDEEAFKVLMNVVINAFDLRKRVKDVQGNLV